MALQEYPALKAEKEKAVEAGNYDDFRKDIAQRYSKLLSYTEESGLDSHADYLNESAVCGALTEGGIPTLRRGCPAIG